MFLVKSTLFIAIATITTAVVYRIITAKVTKIIYFVASYLQADYEHSNFSLKNQKKAAVGEFLHQE